MFGLTFNESLTLVIAAYAAVVSTFVLGWDAYKWLNEGPKIRITASTGIKIVGGGQVDPKTYVSVTAVNYGDRATTITNMGFLLYKTWFGAYVRRNRADQAFIVTTPSQAQVLPYRFEAGAQWIGMADQTEDVDQMIREGFLFALLYCSTSGKGIRVRLTRKEHSTVAEAGVGCAPNTVRLTRSLAYSAYSNRGANCYGSYQGNIGRGSTVKRLPKRQSVGAGVSGRSNRTGAG